LVVQQESERAECSTSAQMGFRDFAAGRAADVAAGERQRVQDAEVSNENTASSTPLDEIVHDGTRQMLATAFQADVIA
jgi:hypothetical protein